MKEPILDLPVLLEQLGEAEVYEDEDGNMLQTIYLGSILDLTPSGKVYTPWANGNVDPCPRCEGEGQVHNKYYKKKKWEKLEKKEKTLVRTLVATVGSYHDWPKKDKARIDKLRKQSDHWKPLLTCQECGSLGSLEARLDQDWWEQLESELDTINAWSHGSEGDGLDVMVSRAAVGGVTEE